jgi:predicted acetyltransferase
MIFTIRSAVIKEKEVIFTLFQPYLDELSSFPDEEIDYKDEKGIYHYPYLDDYWRESERHPYLLISDNKIAGFALVRQELKHWEIAEFYVLPEFRRCGLATNCAIDIFKKHPGNWRIEFNKHNQASRSLWQRLAECISKDDISTGELNTSHDYISFSC